MTIESKKKPGLVRSLFQGRVQNPVLFPFPWPTPEVRETSDAVIDMVRDWAADAIDPAAIDRAKAIPEEVLEGLKELGLFGLTVAERYGGAGCGQTTYAHLMEAVAGRCASTVTVLGGHLGLGMKALLLYGTDEQKARWLPAYASGERIGAFALTEAGAGSDAAALRTTADPLPDGSWKLAGRKVWITNGGFANVFTVFARTPLPEKPDAPLMERPISCFLVPRELEGVSTGAPEDKMGLCGSSTTEVGLEDVIVPAENLIGPLGHGFKVALEILNSGRHGLAASCLGQAKLARELALAHAKEREQFGRPIASFGMMQELLAGMQSDIYAIESGTWLTSGLMDRGEWETMLEAACCKMYATERLWQIANDALQITGGTGFMREYAFERIVRDARINMIFEGSNQVLRMMLSTQGLRELLKEPELGSSGPVCLEGVHPDFAAEAGAVEELVPRFAARAREVVRVHGKGVRDAQHELRRLADVAVAIFHMGAVLSRVSSPRDSAQEALTPAEAATARLACRRLEKEARRTLAEYEAPDDALVREVASHMIEAN